MLEVSGLRGAVRLQDPAGYRPQRLRMLQFACTPRRRAKAALFALSPELFRRVMNH